MWIFTRWGFYSCVCARQGSGGPQEPVDPQLINVRTRDRVYLENLQSHLPDLIGGCDIHEIEGGDYAYQILISKSIWSQVMMTLNQEIDYDSFKTEAERKRGFENPHYVQLLRKIWTVLRSKPSGEPVKKKAKQKT